MSEDSATRRIRRILLVDDDEWVRRAIRSGLGSMGHDIVEAGTVASALELLPSGFDLVLLDIRLPDGSGMDVATAASSAVPAPLIVVLSGEATAPEAFGLAQLGAIRFLAKPFSLEQLLTAIANVTQSSVVHESIVKTFVGSQNIREVQESVRATMVNQALALTGGNRAEAAKLLRVSRQAIEKYLRVGRRTPPTPGK